jgi:selenide,water dikinase
VIAAVNRAAAAVVTACGGRVLGGHSVRCAEPVFGLCVLGFVHPNRVWRKAGALPGDMLLVSKPLGTGVLLSSGQPEALAVATASMRATNRLAAQALHELLEPPHAVTDVSGYGLLGHAQEIAAQSAVTLQIDTANVPLLPGALAAAEAGVRTSAHRHPPAALTELTPAMSALLQDPQTSGGLLVSAPPAAVPALRAAGFTAIGRVVAGPATVVAT